MASRKSAPKSTAKKATRSEKKPAAKSKSTGATATDRARSRGTATKAKAARNAAAPKSKPSKAVDARARDAKKPAASAAKATKATTPTPDTDKTTPRGRGKGAARKAATQETRTPTSPQTKRTRSKGAAKAAEAPKPVAPAPRKRSASAGPPRTVAVTAGSAIVSKLGRKWSCFQCSASFYDLNRPEPLCPKCGADQRQRPKATASTPAHPPAPRKQPRPMAPLLDDEDDGTVRYDEEFDLGVRTDVDDTEQDLFPPGDVEEDDVFGAEEE